MFVFPHQAQSLAQRRCLQLNRQPTWHRSGLRETEKEEGLFLMEIKYRLEQGPKHTQSTQGGGDRVPKVSVGQLCNKGLWELLPARSGPAGPGIPLSRALFTRYRFSCLFTGSY